MNNAFETWGKFEDTEINSNLKLEKKRLNR